ncbi:unnamed protein product [Ambrosiozyma monospora]|uniref:Unnamed protein product n=1 Tax=Ambrosiozyma monospora TaxID=43982 RepID=A0ACB5SU85_AMBMO|nr:unnamed protein product [Ambrosiozyma monospora]
MLSSIFSHNRSKLEKPLALLTSLIGYHSDLDGILSFVIEDMVFDGIWYSDPAHFEQFAEFVLSNSIKIQLKGDLSNLNPPISPSLLKLFEHGCRKMDIGFPDTLRTTYNYDSKVINFATDLTYTV